MRLTPHVHLVGSGRIGGFRMTDDFDAHVYLLDAGDELALVDAGFGRDPEAIVAAIEDAGLDPSRLTTVLLTHGHADHARGAAYFRRRYGAAVVAHADLAPKLEVGDADVTGLALGLAAGSFPPGTAFEHCPGIRGVREGDEVRVGKLRVEVLETPGHAATHLSFVVDVDDRRVLFAGDALFVGGRVLMLSFPDSSLADCLATVRKLHEHTFDALLPGHGLFALRDGHGHAATALARMDRCQVPEPMLIF